MSQRVRERGREGGSERVRGWGVGRAEIERGRGRDDGGGGGVREKDREDFMAFFDPKVRRAAKSVIRRSFFVFRGEEDQPPPGASGEGDEKRTVTS